MGIAENTVAKKNKKIKEANVLLDVIENDNIITIMIDIDQMIEPQMRPRVGIHKNLYDPLKKYKEILREKFKTELNKKNINIEIDENIYVRSYIQLYSEPPKSFTKIELLDAFSNKIKYNKKPDIDNCVKTIYDTFEGIIFFNDSQIVSETFEKKYGTKERTYIKFTIEKQYKNKKRRISTKEINSLNINEEIKNYLLK